MPFIYNYSHFQYSFYKQPVLFQQLENVNKLWNSNRAVHLNERNQNKNKPRALLFDLAHKQCSGINKVWLHCLASESKGRFLFNNILMFSMRSGNGTNPGRPEQSLTPTLLCPVASHFCLMLPSRLTVDVSHMCITRKGYYLLNKKNRGHKL